MKKLVVFLFTVLLVAMVGSQTVFAQGILVSESDLVRGKVETDGYSKLTKGAMWGQRPEAALIYRGEHPEGCTEYILTEEWYVRFADNEHNANDGNIIVFPAGASVYSKGSGLFATYCGNKIVYFEKVNKEPQVIVKEKIVEVLVPTPVDTTSINENGATIINNYYASQQQETPYYQQTNYYRAPSYGYGYYEYPLFSFGFGRYNGGYVDNSSYYYNKSVNNTYNSSNYTHTNTIYHEKEKPQKDEGGPAPVPGHDDPGNPGGAPGHDDTGNPAVTPGHDGGEGPAPGPGHKDEGGPAGTPGQGQSFTRNSKNLASSSTSSRGSGQRLSQGVISSNNRTNSARSTSLNVRSNSTAISSKANRSGQRLSQGVVSSNTRTNSARSMVNTRSNSTPTRNISSVRTTANNSRNYQQASRTQTSRSYNSPSASRSNGNFQRQVQSRPSSSSIQSRATSMVSRRR